MQLQGRIRVTCMRRDMVQHRVKQRAQVSTPLLTRCALGHAGPTVQTRCVHNGEIQLIFAGTQLVEQIKGGIDHIVRARARAVNFIDHHNRLQTQGQCFFGDKASLWHGAFHRVNEQHHAVDHGQSALNLAPKVGVSRGVHDVDVSAFPADRTVFGQDGDATLFFQIIVVHDPFGHFFIGSKGARLAQQLVDQGGLAMVHVGNDGNVANLLGHAGFSKRDFISSGLSKRVGMSSPALTWAVPSRLWGSCP